MTLEEAIHLIRPGIKPDASTWADIGAGTGMFTKALMEILDEENRKSPIYAADKSPHALWELKPTPNVEIEIVEADFNNLLQLPLLDGIVMANALHYAKDHLAVLRNVLGPLKPDGTFILVEYETETPRPPWVPYPVPFKVFKDLCAQTGLRAPVMIGTLESRYGFEHLYAAKTSLVAVL